MKITLEEEYKAVEKEADKEIIGLTISIDGLKNQLHNLPTRQETE
jgi:hypothetical protein